jgi:hypothetical protein
VELEEAEQYFKSEKFQANYHAYVMESQKQAEYAASPEYQKELAEKKARIEREQMRDSIEQEILQTLHDALARAGARCEDYDDDYRCC